MNPADIPNIEAMLQLWMLGMIRPGAAFIAAPVFGATSVPVQLRLVIALAVGVPAVAASGMTLPPEGIVSVPGFLLVIGEVVIGLAIGGRDAGLVFERDLHFGDEQWTQTLEPRAYYLRVPYRNQDDLPIFDTQEVPFTFGQMFRTNSFVGADRQMDANNLTLAMTTRLLEDSTGTERVSASLGQPSRIGDLE